MVNTCKDTRNINKFQYVAIPSPRDIFLKYGERVNNNPCYGTDANGDCDCVMMSHSVIEQCIAAERSLAKETDRRGVARDPYNDK